MKGLHALVRADDFEKTQTDVAPKNMPFFFCSDETSSLKFRRRRDRDTGPSL
jgi:hypothetical protein